jgi:excinuclease ABC subunit C
MNSQWTRKKNIPDTPGVYIFRDYRKRPLYIGRATSLRDRTKSYFANDLIKTRGPRIIDMVTKSKSVTWQETASVLEAIILESLLIKRYQPFYNVDERDDKSAQYVVITDELWPRVFLARARDLEKMQEDKVVPYKVLRTFGPFTDSGLIKEALKILRKMFPFRDMKSKDPRHEAFYQAIGRSPEKDSEDSNKSYLQTIKYLIMFFEGNVKKLRKSIEKDMKTAVGKLRFEDAGRSKKLLYALDHINDIALIKKKKDPDSTTGTGFRIEAYDIAHISGTNVVGVMVASIDGELTKNEYRKFKISIEQNNDIAGLVEILSRRLNHSEWAYPDIIVVDGNERQYEFALKVLQARRINIPVIAVTKDERHKASSFIGNLELITKYKDNIVAINAEAHRFAVKYHRERRTII